MTIEELNKLIKEELDAFLNEEQTNETYMEDDILCYNDLSQPEVIVILSGYAEASISIPTCDEAHSIRKRNKMLGSKDVSPLLNVDQMNIDVRFYSVNDKPETIRGDKVRAHDGAQLVVQTFNVGSTLGLYKTFFGGAYVFCDYNFL